MSRWRCRERSGGPSGPAAKPPGADEVSGGHAHEVTPGLMLDGPIERVTGAVASPSISKVLERAAIARTEEVVTALRTRAQS